MKNKDDKKSKESIEKFERFIDEQVNTLMAALRIDVEKIHLAFPTTEEYLKEDSEEHLTSHGYVMFSIKTSYRYKRAYLTVYPKAYTAYLTQNFDILTDGLIHELMHIITTPLSDLAFERFLSKRELEDEVERITETMASYARLFLQTMPAPEEYKGSNNK